MDVYTIRKDFKDALDPWEKFDYVDLPGLGQEMKMVPKVEVKEEKLTLSDTYINQV